MPSRCGGWAASSAWRRCPSTTTSTTKRIRLLMAIRERVLSEFVDPGTDGEWEMRVRRGARLVA